MKLPILLVMSLLPALAAAVARETQEEAAIHTRELIAYRTYNIGTLISSYHEDTAPYPDLEGASIGLQEYYAPYPSKEVGEEDVGDLLLLAMPISKIFRNALPPHRPNVTFTVSDLYGLGTGNLAAGRMRIGLFGYIERVPEEQVEACKEAYLKAHWDSRGWIPPNGPHNAFYARLRVERVYDFGGFGDVSYIGFIPRDLYISSGAQMRSAKEAKKDWPVPRQPEEGFGFAAGLWEENGLQGWGYQEMQAEHEQQALLMEEEEKEAEERFRVQW